MLLLKIILDIVCHQNNIFNSVAIILYRDLLEDTGLTQRGARNALHLANRIVLIEEV